MSGIWIKGKTPVVTKEIQPAQEKFNQIGEKLNRLQTEHKCVLFSLTKYLNYF